MEPIDYEFWKFWMAVANFVGLVIFGAYTVLTNRSQVNTSRLERHEAHTDQRFDDLAIAINQQIGDHDRRLERIEERNKHMPTHEDFKRVHARLDQLSEDYKEQKGEFKGVKHMLEVMHQYLLSEGKK